jgi:hypothetical protein
MRKLLLGLVLLLSSYWFYQWMTPDTEISRVRLRLTNATEDTAVRIWGVAFDRAGRADIAKGKQEIYEGVLTGDRAFVVYEPLNDTIIAFDKYTLREEEKNLDLVVRGNKKNGYTLTFEKPSETSW